MRHFYALLLVYLVCFSANAQYNGDLNCSPGVYSSNSFAPSNELIRSTARFEIIENGRRQGTCTGSLLNQVVDGKPRQLFVTARHCIHEGANGQGRLFSLDHAEFVFNFQSNNGNNDAIPDQQPFYLGNRGQTIGSDRFFRYNFTSPVQLLYESSAITNSQYSFGIDIALLEILTPIPPHYNVYYAGWKSDGLIGPGGVFNAPMRLVQHPAGDAKKFAVAPYVAKLDNQVATTCRLITKVLDAIIRLFGGKSVTETICDYIDIPQYEVPVFTTGAIRGGTSGSPFFTNGSRLFGVFSAANGECSNIGFQTAGKFRNAYANKAMRDNLNPSYDIEANLFGINGRSAGCYPDNPLRLSGDYFPASDYQPSNQVVISASQAIVAGQIDSDANGRITAAFDYNPTGMLAAPNSSDIGLEERRLHIYNRADFVFTASQSIRLLPGFVVDAGANFSARLQSCSALARQVTRSEELINPPLTNSVEKESSLLILKPNPTGGQFTCRYTIQKPSEVQINLLSVDGKELMQLLNTSSQNSGTYDFEQDLSTLPVGIYLVQLKTQGGVETKRLLIQR